MRFKVASRVRGLSDEAFREAFGTEEQCRTALVRLRWPDGFVCLCCGHREHCVLEGRGLYQCNRCKKQTSPTAGTIFHATKLPLTLWFAAIHLIVTAKNGISSVELGRRLGVKQPTAWTMKHKIMAVMARREADTPLSGRVEMDDAYLGGARSGGKRGRGAAGKTPFVAAVSTSPEGRPRKLKLVPVKGFRKREIARGAKHWLAPGAAVVTDGLGCWSALDEIACSHQAIRTGSGRQAARRAPFKWVNTTLGNIKSAITGTYRKLGPDHAGRYLASFAWRYNRRYQLETMIPRFVHSRTHRALALSPPHRRMTFRDKQERKCAVCHTMHKGGEIGLGPNLYNVLGRPAASVKKIPIFESHGGIGNRLGRGGLHRVSDQTGKIRQGHEDELRWPQKSDAKSGYARLFQNVDGGRATTDRRRQRGTRQGRRGKTMPNLP